MIDIVIGAAFGDEGKGLMTHYLASSYGKEAMVVRFNGGAQAGHTVVAENSQRHIFHHVGSGTFAGAATFLSRFFVSNPILLLQELSALQCLGLQPKIYIDPDSLITTPYDMMVNQMIEELRGEQRHGSCGVGFAETIERNLHTPFRLTVVDLEDIAKVTNTLQLIRQQWLPQRLSALNIVSVPEPWQGYLQSEDIFELFLHQLTLFQSSMTVSRIDLIKAAYPIVFEGAQGLMLDQTHGWFPHVTRSNTGLTNISELLHGVEGKDVKITYVTRSYLTRHGAGPLPYELSAPPYKEVIDTTNVTNTYQGALRYAWFNLPLIKKFIQTDLKTLPSTIAFKHRLAVTCLDQVDKDITFIDDAKLRKESQASFLQTLANEMQVADLLCSYGPTAETLQEWRGGALKKHY